MPIENEIDRFDMRSGMGVRLMGITYSDANALGCGLKEECDGGLTYLGKQAIDRMRAGRAFLQDLRGQRQRKAVRRAVYDAHEAV